jgi:RelB Antitoxin
LSCYLGLIMALKRQYIVNENNQKIAVQLDIDTFEKIENVLENYALVQLINADDSETLSIDEAKKYYASLGKA